MATKKKTEKPVQLSIWEILEHPLFEKNLTSEMKILEYAGKNYQALKMKIEEQYKKDLATLEMAKEVGMKELLHDYSTPEDFTVKYVEVITKKSRLSAHKRELIENFFGPIIKGTAIDIINEKEKPCDSQQNQAKDSKK